MTRTAILTSLYAATLALMVAAYSLVPVAESAAVF
jgi:hypothetical protein